MFDIRPLLSWPRKAVNTVWLTAPEHEGLLKKTARVSFSTMISLIAVVISGIASGLLLILGGAFNMFIAWPVLSLSKILHKGLLLRGAPPKTFQHYPGLQIQSYIYNKIFNNESFLKGLPSMCLKSTFHDHNKVSPEIVTSWPTPDTPLARSLLPKFLQDQITIPETNLSFWGLFQNVLSEGGIRYWNKNAPLFVPFLFPSHTPSDLNPNAPVLTSSLIKVLQNGHQPWSLWGEGDSDLSMQKKYMFALLICLQCWGISITQVSPNSVAFTKTENFDTCVQEIKNHPKREQLFKQVIASLGECQFSPFAAQLALFLNEHHQDYDISPTMTQPLEQIVEREVAMEKNKEEIPLLETLAALEKEFSLGAVPTPANNRNLSSQNESIPLHKIWSLQNTYDQNKKNIEKILWVPKTITPRNNNSDQRLRLQLDFPPFFCSLEDEKQIAQQMAKNTRELSGPSVSKPKPLPLPLLKMNKPEDVSSQLRQSALPEKVTSKTLPFNFLRSKTPQDIPVERLEDWPPLNKQLTNDLAESFFKERATVPGSDIDFWQFVRLGETPEAFDYLYSSYDNLAKTVLPCSHATPESKQPKLPQEFIYQIQTDPAMASKYLLSVFIYLKCLGIELDKQGKFCANADFAERAARVKANLQQSKKILLRLGSSLKNCGFFYFGNQLALFLKEHQEVLFDSTKNTRRIDFIYTTEEACPELGQWTDEEEDHYLFMFPASSPSPQLERFALPPMWMSVEKENSSLFQGEEGEENALLVWDEKTQRWNLPHLTAPSYFYTKEEQEQWDAFL